MRVLVPYVENSRRIQTGGASSTNIVLILGFPPLYVLALVTMLSAQALLHSGNVKLMHTLEYLWIIPLVLACFVGAVREARAIQERSRS